MDEYGPSAKEQRAVIQTQVESGYRKSLARLRAASVATALVMVAGGSSAVYHAVGRYYTRAPGIVNHQNAFLTRFQELGDLVMDSTILANQGDTASVRDITQKMKPLREAVETEQKYIQQMRVDFDRNHDGPLKRARHERDFYAGLLLMIIGYKAGKEVEKRREEKEKSMKEEVDARMERIRPSPRYTSGLVASGPSEKI